MALRGLVLAYGAQTRCDCCALCVPCALCAVPCTTQTSGSGRGKSHCIVANCSLPHLNLSYLTRRRLLPQVTVEESKLLW